ncbi:MAG TPA: hypothetical protein VJB11_02225 [archaeon]|nr:hypothetical protein [archaeon]
MARIEVGNCEYVCKIEAEKKKLVYKENPNDICMCSLGKQDCIILKEYNNNKNKR